MFPIALLLAAITSCYSISQEDFSAEWNRRISQSPRTVSTSRVIENPFSNRTEIYGLFRSIRDGHRRVEAIMASIRHPLPPPGSRQNHNFGSADRTFMRNYLNSQEGDDMGHILGFSLGGPTHRDNLFPQHRCSNRNFHERHLLLDWIGLEGYLRDFMSTWNSGLIKYRVMLEYGVATTNRPTKIHVNAHLFDNNGARLEVFDFSVSNSPGIFSTTPRASSNRRVATTTTTTTMRPVPPTGPQCQIINFGTTCQENMHNIFFSRSNNQ